jgi:hypothetical protein
MDSLKAPSLSSLISGTDRGSSDSLLGSLNLELDDGVSFLMNFFKIYLILLSSLSFISLFAHHFLQIEDDFLIPPVGDLPSLDAIMSEIDVDSDIGSINSHLLGDTNIKFHHTPTPSFNDEKQQTGSILRHVIFQGVTSQLTSAAVSVFFCLFVFC